MRFPKDLETISAPCAHAATCGGCAYQHFTLAALAQWKQHCVVQALAQYDLSCAVMPTVICAPQSRRRARFAAVRTKKGVRIGFFRARSHEVVAIEQCLLVTPDIQAVIPKLASLVSIAAPRARPIGIWVTQLDSGLDIAIEDGKALDLRLREQAASWAEQTGINRLSWNDEVICTRQKPILYFGSAAVSPPAAAFLQANKTAEHVMVTETIAAFEGAKRVADLFAGCGTFALQLAQYAQVLAVEGSAALVDAMDSAWRQASGLKHLVAVKRDLFRRPLTSAELASMDAVVFDPPRQGAEAQAQILADFKGQCIVGISCEPNSFARDAALLAQGGWQLQKVTPIDQFLWSSHIELMGIFKRA